MSLLTTIEDVAVEHIAALKGKPGLNPGEVALSDMLLKWCDLALTVHINKDKQPDVVESTSDPVAATDKQVTDGKNS